MTHYIWWVPLTIAYYIGFAVLSYCSNTSTDRWYWPLFIYGALCPMWVLVSRVSNNLIIDGAIYDALMFLTFTFTLMILGEGIKLTTLQWSGIACIILGMTLIKV